MAFSGGKERHTSQHPIVLVGLRRPNIRRETFWFPALNLKDIHYNGDSRETLDRFYARYVLLKCAFISKTIATFVQKGGLIWLKVVFYFSHSGHKCNCWLKIVNHWDKRDSGAMCTGKEIKSGLKLVRMVKDVATHTCKLLLRKKPEHWDINTGFCL